MSYLLKQKTLAQIHELMEKGMSAEEIAIKLQAEREKSFEPPEPEEEFSSEIRTISQALAFRKGTTDDVVAIHQLLNSAYQSEVIGKEAFRNGTAVSIEDVRELFLDEAYQWLLLEAPNGFSEETDGLLLGVSCFTSDGVSRKNGVIEGNLGSIRYFAVQPRFHGLCVGFRLLTRTEREMKRRNCCRCMVSIPSYRESLISWIQRKGYDFAKEIPYPKMNNGQLTRPETTLCLFVKSLTAESSAKKDASAGETVAPASAVQPTRSVGKHKELSISSYVSEQIHSDVVDYSMASSVEVPDVD